MRSFGSDDFDDDGNLKDTGLGIGSRETDDGDGDEPKTPAGPSLRDVRVPDDYEDEDLRGVDAQTLLQLLKTAKTATQQAIAQANAATAASQSAAASAASVALSRSEPQEPEDYRLTKEELLTGDPEAINRKLDQLFQIKSAPLLNSIYQNFSVQAYQLSKSDKQSMPYWDEYEDEILSVARTLPVSQTVSLDTWKRVYNHVLDQHRDDVLEREVNRRLEERNGGGGRQLAASSPTLQPGRSASTTIGERGSGYTPDGTDPVSKLSDDQKRFARLLGVKPEEAAKYLIEE